ncbi:L-sorbose 1-dehydrogenase [Zootermopsis nevadensis]|uniref:L-sorbose 1-dehydrogenase n=1 Tax=Zootermopsis nevadensis TaxID=136037 RepID=A0A067QX20_ZOONE|nr:L-sorbose 1-dehydrogenase [Zootermopsis nevadensis]
MPVYYINLSFLSSTENERFLSKRFIGTTKTQIIQKVRAKLKERIEVLRENYFRIGIHVLRSYPESVEAIEVAINYPQLLMVSGVGPNKYLRDMNIPIIHELKVGYNFMGHMAVLRITFVVNQSVNFHSGKYLRDYLRYHSGPLSSPTSIEALAFYDFENSTHPGYPDIELLFLTSSLLSDPISVGITDYIYDTVYKTNEKEDACMIIPILVRPRSRGRVMLSDNNPLHKLLIDTNFLEYPEDSETSLKGVKKALEWFGCVEQKILYNEVCVLLYNPTNNGVVPEKNENNQTIDQDQVCTAVIMLIHVISENQQISDIRIGCGFHLAAYPMHTGGLVSKVTRRAIVSVIACDVKRLAVRQVVSLKASILISLQLNYKGQITLTLEKGLRVTCSEN